MRLGLIGMAAVLVLAPLGWAERIAGKVLDAQGKGVAGSVVIALDQETGLPIGPGGASPFGEQTGGKLATVNQAVTDEGGAFVLDGINSGRYRLIAQSWEEGVKVENVTAVNGRVVRLDGVAENVQVPGGPSQEVRIRPLGTGQVQLNLELPNDELGVLISTRPPGDPVLSLLAWKGTFLTHTIGYNRMPRGATTVKGLPEGEVWLGLWFFGKETRMADLSLKLKAGQTLTVENEGIRFVPDPLDGEPVPGQRIRAIYLSLQKPDNYKTALTVLKENLKSDGSQGMAGLWNTPVDKTVKLPDGTQATVGDLVACMKYASLRRQWKKDHPAEGAPPKSDNNGG